MSLLTPVQAMEAVGLEVARSVPGCRINVYYDEPMDLATLLVNYKCPCGEVSSLQAARCGDVDVGFVRYKTRELTEELRRHVRSEGNEPNF